jgi:catechol 2,3-dioxygenase-like lactoylglutathione lyase family enzyme
VDMKLEVVGVPVSDVGKAGDFYQGLGWRLDTDFTSGPDFRVVPLTPPGSPCSVIFGTRITSAAAGSAEGLQLVTRGGADVSEVFHDASGIFHHAGTDGRVAGRAPEHQSYGSFVSFSDPDGNAWFVQEVTARLPGRVTPAATTYDSASDPPSAMRRASAAHGGHEKRIGQADPNWPDWYAEYMVAERAGTELPT